MRNCKEMIVDDIKPSFVSSGETNGIDDIKPILLQRALSLVSSNPGWGSIGDDMLGEKF